AVARELEPLASGALPEIPVGAPLGADAEAAGGLEHDSDAPTAVPEPPPSSPRSSRRGGAILLGTVGALIVAGIAVVALSSGAARHTPQHGHRGSSVATTQTGALAGGGGTTAAPTTGSSTTASPGSTTSSTTGTPQILAQLNLSSPSGGRATVGIVLVERLGGVVGVVIDAQGVPPNSTRNAYAVWLYNSPTSYRFVGFVPSLVGKNGRLATEGRLKGWAAGYHRLLITLETRRKPTAPGQVVLAGPFRGYP
ncbi:MAG: hypothetical protein KGL16_06295, partial [Acidobacteriota bacterium]|nr:hypothetical protein [Acidobacteriota bacterium]